MGLLNLLPNSQFGYGGARPNFSLLPSPPNSLHYTYSINGSPRVRLLSSLTNNPIPQPSRLDEQDTHSTSKFNSKVGQRYLDKPPK